MTQKTGTLPAVTHLGEVGTLIEIASATGLEFKRECYNSHGIGWTLIDKHDGAEYQLRLIPKRSVNDA